MIILDLGLPDIEGHELLRTIRARNESVPIVVLLSRGDEAGKVQALDSAPTITSPNHLAWTNCWRGCALRCVTSCRTTANADFPVGELSVDLVRRIVKIGETEVKLSPKEYDLLRVLVQHAGKVLTHDFCWWLWDDLTDADLAGLCAPASAKYEADPERPQYILTETGIGYRLRAPD